MGELCLSFMGCNTCLGNKVEMTPVVAVGMGELATSVREQESWRAGGLTSSDSFDTSVTRSKALNGPTPISTPLMNCGDARSSQFKRSKATGSS